MKSKSLSGAKAECYKNPNCYMIYEYHGSKVEKRNEFYYCSTRNSELSRSSYYSSAYPTTSFHHVTYIKGKHINVM